MAATHPVIYTSRTSEDAKLVQNWRHFQWLMHVQIGNTVFHVLRFLLFD